MTYLEGSFKSAFVRWSQLFDVQFWSTSLSTRFRSFSFLKSLAEVSVDVNCSGMVWMI